MTIRTLAVLGIVSWAVSGCGTFNTVFRDDIAATRELRKQKTYCEAIPRIYSGVAFDFCLLHAAPDPTGVLIPLALADIAVSGALDTVVLPYTIYRQTEDGNIRIYR